MDPTVVSQPAGDSRGGQHGNSDGRKSSNCDGDRDARPAALKEAGEDKQRSSAAKKGLQMLMNPASPIIGLTKKFRSRPSRGTSLEGLHALTGMDGSGEFVMTPVASDAARVGNGDGEVSCAGSDVGSVESGESVEEGGGGGSGGGGGGGAGRPKRVTKLARGISSGFRRMKKRPMGASEAMTIGRASLMADSSDNSYVRAHDFDGEGARSYTGGWGKGSSSPDRSSRKIPQDWNLPMTNIPTSSAAQGQGQGQDKAISSSSSSRSRQASPSPSPTKILGMPPPVPPHMQRGFTEPCTAYSSARSLESPRNRKEDLVELGREFGSGDVCRTPSTVTATATPGGHSVQEPEKETGAPRGRPSALEKSKSLSPRGKWGVGIGSQTRSASAERERSRSASPRRVRDHFSRSRPDSPLSVQSTPSPKSHSSVQAGSSAGAGSLQGASQDPLRHDGSHEGEGGVTPRLDTASDAAAAAAAAAAAEVCKAKAKANLQTILHDKRVSDESIQEKLINKEQEQEQKPKALLGPGDVTVAAPPQLGCRKCVPAAPPSELKYGDRLRLWVRLRSPSRNHYRLAGGSDISLNMAADNWQGQRVGAGATPSDGVVAAGGGGYVGSLDKVQRVSKKLFKRSELAMIGQPEGNAAGFAACHFKAVDPENKRQDGDVVHYGDVVLLVDDRDYVWTDNAQLLPGSLRMKPRGSKRQITVAFKPFLAELKTDGDNEFPPVVFGTEGLQIMTMDHGHKDSSSRKRRTSSKKSFHALTAFSKKSSGGSSNVAGSFLCSDGRGEAIVFEVHLPNASPVGDPSPVVTKVTIHVDEQSQHQKHLQQGSAAPPPHPHPAQHPPLSEKPPGVLKPTTAVPSLEAPAQKTTTWTGETPTAPLTPFSNANGNGGSVDGVPGCSHGSGDAAGGSDNGVGVGTEMGRGVLEESEQPRRPKSMVAAKRLFKTVHKRRSSLNHGRSGSFAGGLSDARVSRTNLYSLSPNVSGPGRSPTNAEAASGADDELSEDGNDSSGGEMVMGAFEGLKWGEMVQFKMPAEGEVEPNDPLVTLRLSNRYTATLTSKQLRDNAGLGKFPIKASKMKGPRVVSDPSGDLPSGNGLVYLRCTLTPIVCPGAEGTTLHAQPTRLPSANEQAAGRLGERFLPRALHALLPKQSEAVMERASSVMERAPSVRATSDMGKGVGKPDASGVWPRVVKSSVLMLVLVAAAALLSMSIIRTKFSSSSTSMSMSMPPMPGFSRSLSATPSKGSSSSPSPCASVWDIRRPDGTAYPHSQLSAAAAVLDSPDFDEKSTKGRKHRHQPQGSKSSEEEAGGSGSGAHSRSRTQPTYPGGGRAAASTAEAAKTTTARLPVVPGEGDGGGGGDNGVVRALAGGRADGGQVYGRGHVGVGNGVGFGLRSVVGAIGLAAVAVIAVLMKGLFSFWSDPTSPEPTAPSSPMQAQVHLLAWDGRRMSEAARASEDIDTLFYPPPSGSPPSLEPMPHRFLLAESMDVAKAWARWETTLEWRRETNADNILNKPHPRFALIKKKYAHCFHLPDKGGRVTYYERPGMSDFADMRKAGITKADLLDHYVYCMEYLWQVLQPRQSQRTTIVIDLAGVKFRDLVGESLTFLKTSVGMMSRHYPQRSFKIMILNAPSFFNSVFAMVKPMLNEATKKKIDLLPVANVGEEMLKVIPAEHLPVHYGGTGEAALGESPAELAMLAHVQKVLEENGQTMQTS